jgi:flagellar basal-body rod protein FlgF
MNRGLYIAASGMLAELTRQNQIANDLANASTAGYKPDRSAQASFGDVALQNTANGQTIGSLGFGTQIAQIKTDMSSGPLKETGQPFDLALAGDGFFAVQTAQGTRYTRNGQLQLDANGGLVTATGSPVLDNRGNPIKIPAGQAVTVGPDGTVTAAGKSVARLAVVSLTNATKQGDNLYTGTPGAMPRGTEVKQGFLEGSGADPARAMVDMIVSMRAYEATQRVIHAIDDTLGKGIQSAGGGA